MNILTIALIVVALLLSVGLILVVIVQKSKGGGLASSFAGANNIVGAHKSTDILEKLTWWLFGLLATVCIVVSLLLSRGATSGDSVQQVIEQKASQQAVAIPSLGGQGEPVAPTQSLDATPTTQADSTN